MSNKLSQTASPYLLQHANNPVDWYPWGPEALQRARQEEKPIFLSIGYAACHWCHVMAHESFEDPDTAALMNENFVNIKVDREERPDLDSIYMQATVAMTGQGGWPMSVFLTPGLHPFFAGTYFPPQPRHGLPSFRQVLTSLAEAWQHQRDEIQNIGLKLTEHLQQQSGAASQGQPFLAEMLPPAARALVDSYDWAHGGWGMAPKFPQPMALEFLLQAQPAGTTLKAITHALDAMSRGGLYDVIGGGFSRYSTDNHWLAPHFEKMLYDNAQLALVYLHAWQVTGKIRYRQIVEETLAFVTREMTHPEGGFFSSIDADSEGQEGKYYTWSQGELRELLKEDHQLFEKAYGISAHGNWEGKIILQRALDDVSLAAQFSLSPEIVSKKLAERRKGLFTAREKRPRPGTDEKILTSWNALMLRTFAEAARCLDNIPGKPEENPYLSIAIRNARFLLSELKPKGNLCRSWSNGRLTREVFLEDYAALVLALLELYQTDFEPLWFNAARQLAVEMIERFRDPAAGFFDAPGDSEPLLVRPKDLQDNATPSGNALACEALFKLAALSGDSEYDSLAAEALAQVSQSAPRYPVAFSRWLSAAHFGLGTIQQVAILGKLEDPSTKELIKAVRASYRPNLVLAVAEYPPPENAPALLSRRKMINGRPTAFVCEGFNCRLPVTTPAELMEQLTK
ncbi:MAG: thioredoxin domain-containing protein [Anaerolineales bacterium]|nr:thioredoxin domain-containing protein [Anaerolineales bacterium]